MIAKSKKLTKLAINSILSLFIVFQGLLKIFINFNKILNSKYIILQSGGGFITIIIPDFIRSMKNKMSIYIFFF